MLIPEGYVLSNEIAANANVNIANFSMLYKELQEQNIEDAMLKYGACTFINTKSLQLPKYVYKMIHTGELTDLQNCVLLTYAKNYLECSKKALLDITAYNANPVIKKVQGKTFIEYSPTFINKIRDKTITTISITDFLECQDDVEGIVLDNHIAMVWY